MCEYYFYRIDDCAFFFFFFFLQVSIVKVIADFRSIRHESLLLQPGLKLEFFILFLASYGNKTKDLSICEMNL